MAIEAIVTKRDGFEYGKQVSDGTTPDIVRFGQVVKLKGLINDGKLLDMGYFQRFDESLHGRVQCSGCGREFAQESYMLLHLPEHTQGTGRASDRPLGPIVINERESEESAMRRSGMQPKTVRGDATVYLPDNRKECPMGCGALLAPTDVREHVLSCTAGQPVVAGKTKKPAAKRAKTEAASA